MEQQGSQPVSQTPQPQQPTQPTTSEPLMKEMPKESKKNTILIILGAFVVIILGVGTGWFVAGSGSSGTGNKQVTVTENGEVMEAGVASEEDDTAEGILLEGGVEEEGTHRFERSDDPQHDVALTSTSVDLQAYVDKKVQVWGQTLASDNAPWLMDVSKIKVLEE